MRQVRPDPPAKGGGHRVTGHTRPATDLRILAKVGQMFIDIGGQNGTGLHDRIFGQFTLDPADQRRKGFGIAATAVCTGDPFGHAECDGIVKLLKRRVCDVCGSVLTARADDSPRLRIQSPAGIAVRPLPDGKK